MTRINLTQNESKVLRALVEDSRLTVNEIAGITSLNRNTVRSAIKSLISNKVITRFTVSIFHPDSEKLVLLELDNLEQVPEGDRMEVLELANGRYFVLSSLDLLERNIKYISVNIVSKWQSSDNISTSVRTYCDYCGKEIREGILIVKHKNHEYYACCKNCKNDLEKKLARADD
ncbi:MAG: hypothetical protein B2I17_01865 [Thermoplasmatales archaeon B_DKE]|nr:MAG: hypothetical protein B2I17_01865 [Thermoplasmatales archaeon B_DKE]